ncbi:MAG: glycoside hydrolase family 99-like domain-containing protein [Burkholderiales bacterium]|nr:glycoside hydrolase family 99-like domain-containing protein [Burkholderiales bacterium]MCH2240791.1 glycoside hydrolase family 99-like domain-containing protein [Aquabacterium sp.]
MTARCVLRQLHGMLVAVVLGLVGSGQAAQPSPPAMGVFYFPGWKDGALGGPRPRPWEPIRAHPEREPLLGWYDEGSDAVMARHVEWMAAHGIRYIVFDAYWLGQEHQKPLLDHALQAYLRLADKRGVQFALMWANDPRDPARTQDFYAMLRHWLDRYLAHPSYLRIEGRPAVFTMLAEPLDKRARLLGTSSGQLWERAQSMARAAGLPGLFVVGGIWPLAPMTQGQGRASGYSAYFAYNLHSGPGNRINGQPRASRSYAELDQAYRDTWDWFMQHADLPYIVPTSAGWDRRPWGGSDDPLHDRSAPTADQFRAHLAAARAIVAAQPARTLGLSVLCCWNEFGEGSYVEPTRGRGISFLQAVQATFGK